MVFVAVGTVDVEEAVPLDDPLIEEEAPAEPWRRVLEDVVVEEVDMPVAVELLPTRGVPIPRIVVVPRVVVLVVEPLVIVERLYDVEIADDVSTVDVEDMER